MNTGDVMLFTKHDQSHIVELEDGSRWRIWPGDIAATLQWLPTTELQVVAIDGVLLARSC
jgi:FtsP/CotA-like multicopper oxidase with cupredoxin domain